MTDGLLAAYLAEYVSRGRQAARDVAKMKRFGWKERGALEGFSSIILEGATYKALKLLEVERVNLLTKGNESLESKN